MQIYLMHTLRSNLAGFLAKQFPLALQHGDIIDFGEGEFHAISQKTPGGHSSAFMISHRRDEDPSVPPMGPPEAKHLVSSDSPAEHLLAIERAIAAISILTAEGSHSQVNATAVIDGDITLDGSDSRDRLPLVAAIHTALKAGDIDAAEALKFAKHGDILKLDGHSYTARHRASTMPHHLIEEPGNTATDTPPRP